MITELTLEKCGDLVLGITGPIASKFPGYTPRQPQIELANQIAEGMLEGKNVIAEAGTGTGKSFAYLVPAVLFARETGKRVLVSTDSIALQSQIIGKDLPFLESVMGPIRYATCKGKGNYFCRRNAEIVVEDPDAEQVSRTVVRELISKADSGDWNGDKVNADFVILSNPDWSSACADDSCTGTACPHFNNCGYQHAKALASEAEIVVANHTITMLSRYLVAKTAGMMPPIIPDHAVCIFDEAHTVPEKVQQAFGKEFSQARIPAAMRYLKSRCAAIDIELDYPMEDELMRKNSDFFRLFTGATAQETLTSEFPEEVLLNADHHLAEINTHLKRVSAYIYNEVRHVTGGGDRDLDSAFVKAANTIMNYCKTLQEDLSECMAYKPRRTSVKCPACKNLEISDKACGVCFGEGYYEAEDRNTICFVTVERKKFKGQDVIAVKLNAKPADTAKIMRDHVLNYLHCGVFTSATLASGPGIEGLHAMMYDLGLAGSGAIRMRAQSPFDYMASVSCFIPKFNSSYEDVSIKDKASWAADLVKATKGNAFILFTSTREMKAFHSVFPAYCDYPLFLQGEYDKQQLLRMYLQTSNGVLLGLKTFWTGVDIPGDKLSCVIVASLPFPAPNPLINAKCKALERKGNSGFMMVSLPMCVRDLLQGFGRLIRSDSDRGIFALLDSRAVNARYAGIIRDSFPEFHIFNDTKETRNFYTAIRGN